MTNSYFYMLNRSVAVKSGSVKQDDKIKTVENYSFLLGKNLPAIQLPGKYFVDKISTDDKELGMYFSYSSADDKLPDVCAYRWPQNGDSVDFVMKYDMGMLKIDEKVVSKVALNKWREKSAEFSRMSLLIFKEYVPHFVYADYFKDGIDYICLDHWFKTYEVKIGDSGLSLFIPKAFVKFNVDNLILNDSLTSSYRSPESWFPEIFIYQWEEQSFQWYENWLKRIFSVVSNKSMTITDENNLKAEIMRFYYRNEDYFCTEYMFHKDGKSFNVMFRSKDEKMLHTSAAGIFMTLHTIGVV